jgi:lysozyme family protein
MAGKDFREQYGKQRCVNHSPMGKIHKERGEDAVPPFLYLLSLIGSIRTAQLGTAPSWAIPVRLFTLAKGKWIGT